MQAFEGVCIARAGSGVMENFTVRKISFGEGVERVFPLLSPSIESIEVKRRGHVRRAKLYYLRDRRGKSARIAERPALGPRSETATSPAKNKRCGRRWNLKGPGYAGAFSFALNPTNDRHPGLVPGSVTMFRLATRWCERLREPARSPKSWQTHWFPHKPGVTR